MSKYYAMYRLNGTIKVIECDTEAQAEREAIGTKGKAWVYSLSTGWWYLSKYQKHFYNWKIGKGKRKGRHNYYDVTQIQANSEVPEDYKLHALLLGN